MLVYRKDLDTPLSSLQVDKNFEYLMQFSVLLNSCSYLLARECASLMIDSSDYVLSGVQSFNILLNETEFKCFSLQSGSFVDITLIRGSAIPECLELALVDENGTYFDFDINRADSNPVPFDCFLLVKMSDIEVSFTFSDVAIVVAPQT
ncbi:hypothetical protein [Sulfurimonas sp.]|uniref:hypothetical protein n=1 Tax=Sulfurimonas sp. TaxID=2022749 RepID=UPI002623DC0A|nr:hypothetical protein [Sulfurimonas sp.]MDD5156869.1 hypothetical protein [Sulfurimonas sp.]